MAETLLDRHPGNPGLAERELLRVLNELDILHRVLADYERDVDRVHPVGFTYLTRYAMKSVVEVPMGRPVDVLLRVSSSRNYSVQDIEKVFDSTFIEDSRRGRGQAPLEGMPVVLSVPALDPHNAFLAPVLVHEAAHLGAQNSVLSSVVASVQRDMMLVPDAPDTRGTRSAYESLTDWLEEIICDSVAAYVAGPSWLLSAISFLGAPNAFEENRHPSANFRVVWIRNALREWGWGEYIASQFPAVDLFVDDIEGAIVPGESGTRGLVDARFEQILELVSALPIDPLLTGGYRAANEAHELVESMRRRFIPPRLGDDAPNVWSVLLAAWESQIGPDSEIESVSRTIGDPGLNRFLVRAYELVGISRMWRGGL